MKILFDQGVPAPLRRAFSGHDVITAFEFGWHQLSDGDLLDAAEAGGFDVMLTTDKNLRYQQALSRRPFAVVVLMTTDWRGIRPHADRLAAAVTALTPGAGAYIEFDFPPT